MAPFGGDDCHSDLPLVSPRRGREREREAGKRDTEETEKREMEARSDTDVQIVRRTWVQG